MERNRGHRGSDRVTKGIETRDGVRTKKRGAVERSISMREILVDNWWARTNWARGEERIAEGWETGAVDLGVK